MKQRFLIYLIALFSLGGFAQSQTKVTLSGANNQATITRGGIGANSALWLPVTSDNLFSDVPMKGRLRLNDVTSKLEVHDGIDWIDASGFSAWKQREYSEGQVVTKEINSVLYVFKSTSNSNETEPLLLSEKEAWSLNSYGGTYVAEWLPGTYTAGKIVSRSGWAYYCLTTNNTDPVLLSPPNWIKLGKWRGSYNTGTIYNNGDVVVDGSNIVHISNYDNNNYPVNYGIVSKWTVITDNPTKIVCWGDSLTAGAGSTGNSNYPATLSILSNVMCYNQGVPGETSTQIKTRFFEHPELWHLPTIFWVGRNNYGDPETVKADLAEMIAALGHDNYLVVGIIKATTDGDGPIETLTDELLALYGSKFLDLQRYLLRIYDASNAQDVADHAAGDIAWSMRSDWLHLNNKGYFYVAKFIESKLNLLLGKEYGYYTNMESGGIRVTNNTTPANDTAGLELLYRPDLGKAFVQAYSRKDSEVLPLSVGYASPVNEAILYLIENGGELYIGSPGTWTSGNVSQLVRDDATGRALTVPKVPTNYIPASNPDGTLRQSLGYDTGNEFSIGSPYPESGYKFQVEGATRIGVLSGVSLYLGQFNTTKGYISARNAGITQDIQMFTKSFLVGSSDIISTGEALQVGGKIKATSDIEITDATKGVIMTDTVTGTRYRMQITSGAITITALP
ncbi:SGNH/GDSL hydrolase family protein [Flavobacterium cerinum]|uniref:SGNH/GDSL hydrolase family protein n=1 Tax=Flavobacterium cerinum TaxID=2502784 RepID=A0A444GLL6_9FLAO|nr:SGNH/GDSL hydrolase family protein [Flavobacterium cerinum]RWW91874.1 SGNH/GDSL hydrolase family protein [Flavobacterium cerinum]